jgi:membrane protease subunit (stomatin/prohibitin family)
MRMRRRPLLGAAVVGGVAYHAGKKGQQSRDQEADQNAQIADLQAQQQQQQYQAPAPAAPSQEDSMAKLTQLKSLLDQGVLTQAEFDVQKTKILQGM